MADRTPATIAQVMRAQVHAAKGADRDRLQTLVEWFEGRIPDALQQAFDGERGVYEDLGPLGRGGMGEVRRVRDPRLDRTLVRKTLFRGDAKAAVRFWVEAAVTARLDHPGIVPVHDFGLGEDGRPWFVMKEVEGRTMRKLAQLLHKRSWREWERTPDGWTLRRAVAALAQAANAMGFAHSRGVIHRDLKPENIMIGRFGAVYVIDWGLALVDPDHWPGELPDQDGSGLSGTPHYMAPEQAWAQHRLYGPHTDVWALGACLYELLTGRPPYLGRKARAVLNKVRKEPFTPLSEATELPLPPGLVEVVQTAMKREPAERYPDGQAFARALEEWLDGEKRLEQADQLVDEALRIHPEIAHLRRDAEGRREHAEQLLAQVKSWDPVAVKAPAWTLQDQAAELDQEAVRLETRYRERLQAALLQVPEHEDAHRLIARELRRDHERALEQRDALAAIRIEAELRQHDRGEHAAWLSGVGRFSLRTEPAGARMTLYRFEELQRRLEPVETGIVAETPVAEMEVPAGSYLALLEHPDCEPTRLPLVVPRGAAWDNSRPGDEADFVVPLPARGELGPEDHYVPAGWAILGNPDYRNGLPRRRIWVDGFVMRRHPVTNREFLAFLNDLVEQGRVEEAEEWAPKEAPEGGEARIVYHREGQRFVLGVDATGDAWDPEWPVCLVSWHAARAWCAWESRRSGRDWRLPWELEREKAAVGADGRSYPWGEFGEPTWMRCASTSSDRATPSVVGLPAEDIGPYGICGLAGNIRDWCMDVRASDGPRVDVGGRLAAHTQPAGSPEDWRVTRGGCWSGGSGYGRAGYRFTLPSDYRLTLVGFRGARSWPPQSSA